MTPPRSLLVEVLLEPKSSSLLTPLQWDVLVRQGRRANLLSRLAFDLRQAGQIESAIAPARPHVLAALAVAQRQEIAIRWEVECLRVALRETGVPLILLKGAAYVMARLPAAHGRVFSDVDIIVPEKDIPNVESALMLHGWSTGHHGPYYQRYYRKWMHEIPPMRHVKRGTVIDVHHALLPRTARIKVDSDRMRKAAVAVPDVEGVWTFTPIDMVLHSATHLFHEGELDNGLRDLVDLDRLLRHFGTDAKFWEQLVPRAIEVGLTGPLYYALRYASQMLHTPVPPTVKEAASAGSPGVTIRALADFAYLRALLPNHATCDDYLTPFARGLLYLRSHWMRMPMPLLVYHLVRKAIVDDTPKADEAKVPTPEAP